MPHLCMVGRCKGAGVEVPGVQHLLMVGRYSDVGGAVPGVHTFKTKKHTLKIFQHFQTFYVVIS